MDAADDGDGRWQLATQYAPIFVVVVPLMVGTCAGVLRAAWQQWRGGRVECLGVSVGRVCSSRNCVRIASFGALFTGCYGLMSAAMRFYAGWKEAPPWHVASLAIVCYVMVFAAVVLSAYGMKFKHEPKVHSAIRQASKAALLGGFASGLATEVVCGLAEEGKGRVPRDWQIGAWMLGASCGLLLLGLLAAWTDGEVGREKEEARKANLDAAREEVDKERPDGAPGLLDRPVDAEPIIEETPRLPSFGAQWQECTLGFGTARGSDWGRWSSHGTRQDGSDLLSEPLLSSDQRRAEMYSTHLEAGVGYDSADEFSGVPGRRSLDAVASLKGASIAEGGVVGGEQQQEDSLEGGAHDGRGDVFLDCESAPPLPRAGAAAAGGSVNFSTSGSGYASASSAQQQQWRGSAARGNQGSSSSSGPDSYYAPMHRMPAPVLAS